MFVPQSCHSLAQHAQDASFELMPLHLCLGIWQPSSKLMTPPAPMTRTVHPHQVPHLQLHFALLCPQIATRHPCLQHLVPQSQLHLRDWTFHPDLSHPGAQAELPSLLLGLRPITCELHRAVPRYLALLLTQPFHFRHSQSHQLSLLWSLTLVPTQ